MTKQTPPPAQALPSRHPALPDLAALCGRAHDILAGYYALPGERPDFEAFLLPPHDAFGAGGAVLFLEGDDEGGSADDEGSLSLGLCFGTALVDAFVREGDASLHTVAVVAEETSHFLTLSEAATREVGVSRLELETLGEIDRFLALLHWSPEARVSTRSLCDAMFEGHRFDPCAHVALYVEAEARAFLHLRRAFARVWENRAFDASRVDAEAACYLRGVRDRILSGGVGSPAAAGAPRGRAA